MRGLNRRYVLYKCNIVLCGIVTIWSVFSDLMGAVSAQLLCCSFTGLGGSLVGVTVAFCYMLLHLCSCLFIVCLYDDLSGI